MSSSAACGRLMHQTRRLMLLCAGPSRSRSLNAAAAAAAAAAAVNLRPSFSLAQGHARIQSYSSSAQSKTNAGNAKSSAGSAAVGQAPPRSSGKQLVFLHRLAEKQAMTSITNDSSSITFQDLIKPRELRRALFSSYEADTDWFVQQLAPMVRSRGASVQLFVSSSPTGRGNTALSPNINMTPLTIGKTSGRLHGRLMLLFHGSDTLRVAVTSASLVPSDWGVLENVTYYQDFPIEAKRPTVTERGLAFQSTLMNYVTQLVAHQPKDDDVDDRHPARAARILKELKTVNFDTVEARLISSYPEHSNLETNGCRQGLMALEQALQAEYSTLPAQVLNSPIIYQSSSIGQVSDPWVTQFATACNAGAPARISGESRGSPFAIDPADALKLQFIFPTTATVSQALQGFPEGHPHRLHFFPRYFSSTFPRGSLFDYQSKHGNVLPNSKVLLRVPDEQSTIGYAVIGSHSLGIGSWGNGAVSSDSKLGAKATSKPRMMRNFELSVLIPGTESDQVPLLKRVAVPFCLPARPYSASEHPFLWLLSHKELLDE
ncbi:hypothetical protein CAOG_07128 [Capsaspora owczarzaki ATCC 30864]|uniref:Uncharacterized protein n=1 Tax=Capsaspora owczarzaki (strain ATCC 30864) TaxID=595528 RepID=A0A0D2X4Y6_CAPO3|nr:hypothetical protein CAOG_07128 [Capsaspora owczarzaki ATCC 30864]KJE96874.1 hypothetical protein CAOG_007128 [Capsaspora owczarzaki ATCC 30864]KJE96875.1 hypothetical protein, variant [Capsaspora owczarzaki ATCC 30864]|eukprot:XP_004343852.1 hypothetical protein CAOG_07128 [Capsaspora owczarzaki ATCC 30864]